MSHSVKIKILALVFVAQFLAGCATLSIEGGDTPGNVSKTETTVLWCYGLFGKTRMEGLCNKYNNKCIAIAKVHTNIFHTLCAGFTLGLIQPITIEYTCCPPCSNGPQQP
jgi:hypothetical protein